MHQCMWEQEGMKEVRTQLCDQIRQIEEKYWLQEFGDEDGQAED